MKIMLLAFFFFVLNLCGLIAHAQTPDANHILYVDINATGAGTGTTWADAIPQLADALKWARTKYNTNNAVFDTDPLKIYVAKGTYKPMYNAVDGQFTTNGGRDNAFVMVKNVQLYGGFDPANDVVTLDDHRIFGLAGSILSGDVNGDDIISGAAATLSITGNTENNYHVALSVGDVGTAELNGFTITGGNANTNGSATINGKGLSNLAGGALNAISSSPKINRCMIVGNSANWGGGVSTNTASPNIINCIITKNYAVYGGGVYSGSNSPSRLLNCVIIENKATSGGGGINAFSSPSPSVLTNVTIANNGAIGLSSSTTTPIIQNSIIWDVVNGSYTASYSLIKGSTATADNNINAGALTETNVFNNYLGSDYRLKATSPAVNKGSVAFLPAGYTIDVDGRLRVRGSVDIGAYEYSQANALHFEGTNDYVRILNSLASSAAFTIEFWMRTTQVGGTGTQWYNGRGLVDAEIPGAANDFGIALVGAKLAFGIGNADKTIFSTSNVNTGKWTHVAAVWDATAGTMQLYINGKLETSANSGVPTALRAAPTTITLGAINTLANYYRGGMDELRIWKVARTAVQIDKNFDKVIASGADLLNYYDFDNPATGGYTTLHDQTENANHGTLSNFTLTGSVSNWVESYAMVIPTANAATATSANSFQANWSAPSVGSADNGYMLDVATNADFSSPIVGSPFTVNAVTKEVAGLTSGTNYYYRVRADKVSVTGQGTASETITLTTNKADQTISFAVLDPKTTANADYALAATASSGLTVSYISSNTAVAEVYQDAGVWKVKIKGAGNTDITASQVGNTNYNAASDVIQNLVVIDAVLPVELISFTAKVEDDYAKLQWQTSSETNNKSFEVYRSGNDKQFVKIGEVSANINHQPLTINHYSYFDKQPLNGNNYYKLVQVDQDGKPTEIGERALSFSLAALSLSLYPNPTENQVTVSFAAGRFSQLQLLDVAGRVLQQFVISSTANHTTLSMGQYSAGTYLISLGGKGINETRKVVRK